MNKPSIGLKEKIQSGKKIHPKQCPKCKSKNIIGRGLVIGYAYINLENINVDELGDDFEILDEENLRYRCFSCGNEWDE